MRKFIIFFCIMIAHSLQAQISLDAAYSKTKNIKYGHYTLSKWFKPLHKDTALLKYKTYFDEYGNSYHTDFYFSNGDYYHSIWFNQNKRNDTLSIYGLKSEFNVYNKKQHKSVINQYKDNYLYKPLFAQKSFENLYIYTSDMKYRGFDNYRSYSCFVYSLENDEIKRFIYVNQYDSVIVGYSETYFTDGDYQHLEFFLQDYNFRVNPDKDIFSLKELDSLKNAYKNKVEYLKKENSFKEELDIWIKENHIISDSLKNKILYIYLWHLGCYPCIKGLPSLQELQNEINSSNFAIICINPYDKKELIDNLFLKKGINLNSIPKEDLESAGLPSGGFYPRVLIYDNLGNILCYESGYHPSYKKKHKALILNALE